jgi:glycosyltransferase involved in cell wall biosynthesis
MVFATLIPRLLGAKIMLQMYEPTPELWATRLGVTQIERLKSVSRGQRLFIGTLRRIEQACLRYAHASFAVTQQLKDNFVAYGADPSKITVILNVPDENLFRATDEGEEPREPDSPPNGKFRLLCHGAIEERYGHDNMLQAVAALRATVPGLELRITGNGSYREELVAQIESLGLQDHVKYLGWVSLAELVAELENADVGIVAQKSSSYSNLVHTGKMYDFMAFGKPVIASRLGAVQAYFDDDSLCYFIPGDSDDLARAILELYENPSRRQELARNSGRLYEEYCWKKQRAKYWAAYANLDK